MDTKLFDGSVRLSIRGRETGNFHPDSPGSQNLRWQVLEELEASRCFSPRPQFTNLAVWEHDRKRVCCDTQDERLFRTNVFADSGLTRHEETAISFWNADCPIGVLYSFEQNALALVHLGLWNLLREDLTILHEALRESRFAAQECLFWFGFGAGPCCYGHTDPDVLARLRSQYGGKANLDRVTKGPRFGMPAVDLPYVIETLALEMGFHSVASDSTCTACHTNMLGHRTFWSHVYGETGRNGVFVKRIVK